MKRGKLKKNDWVGLGTSVGVHLILVLIMSLMVVAATDEIPVGFIEVEFGQFSEGRPTVRTPKSVIQQPEPPVEAEPDEIEKPAVAPPEVVRPVDLPDVVLDISDDEIIEATDAETIQPEEIQAQEEIVDEVPELPSLATMLAAVTVTVLASIVAHGVSAGPLVRAYGRHAGRLEAGAAEHAAVPEMPTRGRMSGPI